MTDEEDNGGRLGLPDRRKHTYEALEGQLDNRLDKIEARIEKWFRRGFIAFGIIGLSCAVALAGFGYLLTREKDRNLQLCENQNVRNTNAITGLMVGSNLDQVNSPTEAGKAEIRRRRDVTIGIIDGLAPKVNCKDPSKLQLIKPVVTAPPTPPPPKPTPTETP